MHRYLHRTLIIDWIWIMNTKLNGNKLNTKKGLTTAVRAGLLFAFSAAPFAVLGMQMLNFFMAGVVEQ